MQRFLTRMNDGQLDAALVDVAPDAQLDWSRSDVPDGGVHQGRGAWRAWMSSRSEVLSGQRFDASEVVDVAPDTVVVIAQFRGRGRVSGIETSAVGATVWKLRDGKIAALTLYRSRAQALEAAGLA